MHTCREKVWASPLVRRSAVKRPLNRLYIWQFFQVFVFLQVSYLISFSTPDLSWDTPLGAHALDLKVKASGRSKTHYDLVLPLDFWYTRKLSAHVWLSLLSQKRGERRSFNPLLEHGFAPLCPCRDHYLDYYHDCYLKVFTRDKHWLFTLSAVTSISDGNQEAACNCLNWSPPVS